MILDIHIFFFNLITFLKVSFIKIANFFTYFEVVMSYMYELSIKKEIVIQLLIVPYFKIPDFNKQSIKSIVEKFKKTKPTRRTNIP